MSLNTVFKSEITCKAMEGNNKFDNILFLSGLKLTGLF